MKFYVFFTKTGLVQLKKMEILVKYGFSGNYRKLVVLPCKSGRFPARRVPERR